MPELREISLGNGCGDMAIKVNGARIEVHADGSIAAHKSGDIDVYTDASVRVHPAGNDNGRATTASPAELKPGDRTEDGTIYGGISPDSQKPMYTTAEDAKLTYTFNEAHKYAEKLDAHGHQDWRVPTEGELNLLFQNRGAIGGFNVSDSDPAGWYWSSREYGGLASVQRFSGGS